MSQSSVEARDAAATTATALSLDSKTTESQKMNDSKTKSNSKVKVDVKSKTKSGSKTEPSGLKGESSSKTDLKTKLQLNAKSESAIKVESASKVTSELTFKEASEGISDIKSSESERQSAVLKQQSESRSNTKSASKPVYSAKIQTTEGESLAESATNVAADDSQSMESASKAQPDAGSSVKLDSKSQPDSGKGKQGELNKGPASDRGAVESNKTSSKKSDSPAYGGASNTENGSQQTEDTRSFVLSEDTNPAILPIKNNTLYNTTAILEKLDKHPSLKLRCDGKYYLKMKDVVCEQHPKVKRNKRGDVIPTIKKEVFGVIERIVSRFCEDVLCISRAQFLPLSSQGERHLIWVGKKKANHIIRYLNGNGCYVVNRFPGDIFMKDKQVMGIILRDHMLMRSNRCYWKCGVPKEDIRNPKKETEDEEENPLTYRICRHMVKSMHMDEDGCEDMGCYNFEKHTCKHLDVFIPEVQSFCTYNALQDFSNRLEDDLKGQTFVCKPAYLYKGYGFRFFRTAAEFQEFYHMTEGKETSRHDFMVQRLIDKPFLFNYKKVDIRAFLLVVVLRYRRVISFVHYGFCRVASTDFEPKEQNEEMKIEETMTDKEITKKKAEEYETDMKMFVCTYRTEEEKQDRVKRMDSRTLYEEADDRSQELLKVFTNDEDMQKVKEQIRHIGIRLSQAIESKMWDAFGCFQIFGLDLCVAEDMKVWLLEVNSHAMSDVDTLSPTQRKVVPAVIMEALGLVVESTYKSFHHLRLRKSPTNEFEETGFLFRLNYDFIFSTLAKKRMDYVWPKPPKRRDLPYYERIGQVDEQIKSVERRKRACLAMKIAVREEQLALKRKRNAKDEEES